MLKYLTNMLSVYRIFKIMLRDVCNIYCYYNDDEWGYGYALLHYSQSNVTSDVLLI